MSLRLDWATHKAAVYAVKHWHYSRSMPLGRLVKIGVWENASFIGVVVFAQGNNQHQGRQFGLTQWEVCELARIALCRHGSTVSRIVSLSLRYLVRFCPLIRFVVSYADPMHGHHGGIYQAGNWIYVGTGGSSDAFYDSVTGKRLHSRAYSTKGSKTQFGRFSFQDQVGEVTRVALAMKHKYLMPLDAEMRARILPLSKPYPKRTTRTKEQDAVHHTALGGVTPTRALHT
jgi:hypothetical protein